MIKEAYVYTPNGEISRYKLGDEMSGYGFICEIETNYDNGFPELFINIENKRGSKTRGWIHTAGLPFSIMK